MSDETLQEDARRQMRNFGTGATRDADHDKIDYEGFLSPFALEAFGKYMHKHRKQADGKMRASDNWKLGIPLSSYVKSMTRHLIDFLRAWAQNDRAQQIDLACAILFNVQGFLHESTKPQFIKPEGGAFLVEVARDPDWTPILPDVPAGHGYGTDPLYEGVRKT